MTNWFGKALLLATILSGGLIGPALQAISTDQGVVKPKTSSGNIARAQLRLEGSVANMKVNKRDSMIAFTDPRGFGLRVMEMKTGAVFEVTRHFVGPSFFWSPDGFRVVYREMMTTDSGQPQSRVNVYDTFQKQTTTVDTLPSLSGFLTFDPRDMRLQLLHDKGILSRRLVFPEERLARWQMAQRTENGKFLASPKGMLWTSQAGLHMEKLLDDNQEIDSYCLSPDGKSMAWATTGGKVYISREGAPSQLIGEGRDPSWHPEKSLLIYAAARRIGSKVLDYDLKISNLRGQGRYLTRTPSSQERWPVWINGGKSVLFTLEKSTDIYRLEVPL